MKNDKKQVVGLILLSTLLSLLGLAGVVAWQNHSTYKEMDRLSAKNRTEAEAEKKEKQDADPAYRIIKSIDMGVVKTNALSENMTILVSEEDQAFILRNLGSVNITDCKFTTGINNNAATLPYVPPGNDVILRWSDFNATYDNSVKEYKGYIHQDVDLQKETRIYDIVADCYADGRRKGTSLRFSSK